MIKISADLTPFMPVNREQAMRIASVADRFECMLTLERDGIVLNIKSMIGLLSQTVPKDGKMTLVADGADEAEAIEELKKLLG